MFPEGLIKPIDRARFEPYFAKMLPGFKPPYKWAMDDSGEHLLGIAQRFGPYSFVVNTDKISRETAEDQAGTVERPRERQEIRRPGIRRLERLPSVLHRRLRPVPRAH